MLLEDVRPGDVIVRDQCPIFDQDVPVLVLSCVVAPAPFWGDELRGVGIYMTSRGEPLIRDFTVNYAVSDEYRVLIRGRGNA